MIDASGSEGQDGSEGSDGINSFGLGAWASNGQSGRNGTNGASAGQIDVTLAYEPDGKHFRVSGTAGNKKVNQVFSVAEKGYVFLRANGGRGGKAGDGGDGGRGSDGQDGQDASQYSQSSRGSDGSNGGGGGDGGDGGHAGPGGYVRVRVKSAETELLWLVRAEAAGGPGGVAGEGGNGGFGGQGGSSGREYCWTEGSGDNAQRKCNGSSSSGNSGSSGFSGQDGRRGSDGADGRAEIIVSAPGGTRTFNKMFELELVSLQLEEQFKDGIYEPGEKISVRSIAYKNVGPMPTPPKSVVFSLVEKGNISGPSTPIRLGTEASIGQNQVFSKSIANNIHSFVLSSPENSGDRFGFQPAVKMGAKVKALDGGKRVHDPEPHCPIRVTQPGEPLCHKR